MTPFWGGLIISEYLTEKYIQSRGEQQADEEGFSNVSGYFYFVNDSEFDKLLEQYKLNKSDYSMSKIKKENPIDALKNENL